MNAMKTTWRDKRVGVLFGGLSAELQKEALHRRRALLHDPLPDNRRAGERDEIDLG